MPILLTNWKPNIRKVVFQDQPEWIPDWLYTQAVAAKRKYNEQWDFWVWQVSRDFNVSQSLAEDACIRGIKKEILQQYVVYGPKIGKWFEEFLEMGDIFNKIKHPEYLAQLG